MVRDDFGTAPTLASGASGWLYAIVAQEVNRVKIGHARNVEHRLQTLQSGSPVELILHSATLESDVRTAESAIHSSLTHARLSGEWFDLSDAAVDQWLATREADTPANSLYDRVSSSPGRRQ